MVTRSIDQAEDLTITTAPGPAAASARLAYVDALRGIALLGILVANVRQMHWPYTVANWPLWNDRGELLAWLDWAFFDAFVELKFITLFSLLFGASFVLQLDRTRLPTPQFNTIYLRRLAILAAFGVAHGLLLYSAEVLLAYAVTGIFLLMLRGYSSDTLLRAGLVLLGASVLWSYVAGYLSLTLAPVAVVAVTALALAFAGYLLRRQPVISTLIAAVMLTVIGGIAVMALAKSGDASAVAEEFGMARWLKATMESDDPTRWPEEFRVRQLESFGGLVALHAEEYLSVLVFIAVVLFWRTLALFLIGAALIGSGLRRMQQTDWVRVAIIGLGIGVPLTCIATGATAFELRNHIDLRWPPFLHALSSLPLAAGIAASVYLLHHRREGTFFWRMAQAAGRMALTNYLGQSAVMAFLVEPWGLGWYAQLSGPAMTLLAILVWAVLALASLLWLARWRMGPLEWLWRCGTYWRVLPNRID